jgi:hypothetical protein
VKLTKQNSPVETAMWLADPAIPGTALYRPLITKKCGSRTVVATFFVAVSFPSLVSGSGPHEFLVTDTIHGWVLTGQVR